MFSQDTVIWTGVAVVIFLILRSMWRAYFDKAVVLGRQGANMNWLHVRFQQEGGYRNHVLGRDGMETMISFEHKNLQLIKPWRQEPFADFVELERWLATDGGENTESELSEIIERAVKEANDHWDEAHQYFYQEIDDFYEFHGYAERVASLQASDDQFARACSAMHLAAFDAGSYPKVAAALTLDAVKEYEVRGRQSAIRFLQAAESNYIQETDEHDNAEVDNAEGDIDPVFAGVNDYAVEGVRTWHPALDRAAEVSLKFIVDNKLFNPTLGDGSNLNLSSEMLTFAVTCVSRMHMDDSIHDSYWSTFKSAIEHRLNSVVEDESPRSGYREENGRKTFVSYATKYRAELDEIEDLIFEEGWLPKSEELELIGDLFLKRLGANSKENKMTLVEYLTKLETFAANRLLNLITDF
ncbi:MAG: hypothetical protein KZQ87_15765 [Candidatus Thiodiazotropha sp. (ex Cardiolucina cf. quadrata)]|nr:hypothetical protein [Candidatus Thiodiazotropha sp. (ex Cardiolucina cf. quadrata)]